jgi:excisionase family DNA binding protein
VVSDDVSQNHPKPLFLCGNYRDSLWTKKFSKNLFCGQYATSIDSFSGGQCRPHRFTLAGLHIRIPTMTGMKAFWISCSQTTPHRYRLCTPILLGVFVRKLASDLPATLSLTTAASSGIWEVRAMTTLLRISDAQERLAASRSTVYRLIRDQKLECVYLGTSPRITDESIERLIDELRHPKPLIRLEGGTK